MIHFLAVLAFGIFGVWLISKLFGPIFAYVPILTYSDTKFADTIVNYCPHLTEAYVPTPLWGFSGHIQTIVHSAVGRVHTRNRQSIRRSTKLDDGATLTWDEWWSLDRRPTSDSITIAICPGIGNSSETVYIWSFVHYACLHGYNCIVLNHLGALRTVHVTSPRIFTYGRTEEFDHMLRCHTARYPLTRLVLVGFSMGGNIVAKYMGQSNVQRPASILGAISVCQGYDAQRCARNLGGWMKMGSLYMRMMTYNMKLVVSRHRNILLSEEVKSRHDIDEARVFGAADIPEFDEAYMRRVNGYDNVDEFYRDNSSYNFLEGIDTPIVYVNARDDPLVPSEVLEDVRRRCTPRRKTLLIETDYGGHLGFYEGGFVVPHSVTWLDRTVLKLVNGLSLRN